LWLCLGLGAVLVGLFLSLSRLLPSPFPGLTMDDFKHNPHLAENPAPVRLDIRTVPARMEIRYRLGWETLNSRPRKRIYRYDVTDTAAPGTTPMSLRLVDKGYSHVVLEFRRGESVFTKTYPRMPTVVEADFSHEVRYPRLRRMAKATPSPTTPPVPATDGQAAQKARPRKTASEKELPGR
jgi:hypothetical protein